MRRFLDQFTNEWRANGVDYLTWTKNSQAPLTKLNCDYITFDVSGEPLLPPLDAFTNVPSRKKVLQLFLTTHYGTGQQFMVYPVTNWLHSLRIVESDRITPLC